MAQLLVGDALVTRAEAALAVALPDALGLEFVDPADPLAGVVLEVGGIAVTPAATLHGSALAAALELAAYLAVLPTLTVGEHAVTHQLSVQYLRAATVGQRVRVRGELARRTRALAFVGVSAVLESDGTAVAQGQVTKSVVAF